MCLRFVFLLITRMTSSLRLSRREEALKTAEVPLLRVHGPAGGRGDQELGGQQLRRRGHGRTALSARRGVRLGRFGSHRIPRPARTRGGDGDRGQLPDRRMCGDGPPGEPVVECRSTGFPIRSLAMTTTTESTESCLAEAIGRIGKHWGWMLAFGILTIAAGICALVWPGITLRVIL